ncbi:hypothetical protein HN588_10395 [Candidatus Bathyarchaeota archaeon]|nr:hypothetical protein [Candidatus Bathyarchaeota archaeon]
MAVRVSVGWCIIGWLDHSTNNILLDSVLTDVGREFLSKNDGSFSIVKFALSDDEVDYSIIRKFGRTVGKEKIEKNTPVFEALTNQNFAQKYRLIALSNPSLVRLPSLTLTGEGLDSTGALLSMGRTGTGKSRRVILSQTITDEDSIDVELRDQAFLVRLPNDFVQLSGVSPDNIDQDNIATYLVTRDSTTTAVGGSQLTLDVEVKSIPDRLFTIRGLVTDKTTIRAFLSIVGLQSGATKDFEVQISKNSAS